MEWDKQLPGEPDNAWRAFVSYRDAGLNRSFQAAGVPLADALKWAKQWHWLTRVKAFDAHFEEIRLEARKEAIKRAEADTVAEVTQAASMGILAAANAIRGILARQAQGDGTAEILKPGEAAKLLETSVKAWRLIHGETTENNETTIRLEDLSEAELAALLDHIGHGDKN